MTGESVASERETTKVRVALPALVALASLMATGAGAQVVAQTAGPELLRSTGQPASAPPAHSVINLLHGGYALSYAGGDAQTAGFPRTAITHRLTRDGPVGSVGYLSGIRPFAPDYYGVGAGPASRVDPGLSVPAAIARST